VIRGTPSVCARVDCPGNTCRSIQRGRVLGGTISSLAENMCVESAVRSLITAAGNITEFRWSNISWGASLRFTRGTKADRQIGPDVFNYVGFRSDAKQPRVN